MLAFLASIGWKALAGKAASNAMGDFRAVGRWLGSLDFVHMLLLVTCLFGAWQTVGRWSQHRHTAKVEAQLIATVKAKSDEETAWRAAATKQKADDDAKNQHVVAQQQAVNKETRSEYQARIAAADALAARLRAEAAAHPRGSVPPVPSLPAPAGGAAQAPGDGFSLDDRLVCTKQGIQLDELIRWSLKQHEIDPNEVPQ